MARGRSLLLTARQVAFHHLDSVPPQNAGYVRDWTRLVPGQKVFVLAEGAGELCGEVGAVTGDGAVLWLHLDAGAGRRLFTRTSGGRVWRVPDDARLDC